MSKGDSRIGNGDNLPSARAEISQSIDYLGLGSMFLTVKTCRLTWAAPQSAEPTEKMSMLAQRTF